MSTKTLARLAAGLTVAIGLVLLSGCAKTKETIKVEKSGQGTTTMTMSLDLSKLKGIQEMMQGMGMGGGENADDPLEELQTDVFKKKLKDVKGVTLVSAKQETDEEKGLHTLTLEIAFDSLEALYRSGAIEGVDAKLEKLPDGNYKFTRVMGTEMAPDTENPEAAAMAEAMLSMFEPFLTDMEFTVNLTLPTTIVETSGEKLEPNQVQWKLGFKGLTKADQRTQTVVFSGEGLDWKPFSVKASEIEDAEVEEDEEVVEEEEEEVPAAPPSGD